jgi:hypothetical protein
MLEFAKEKYTFANLKYPPIARKKENKSQKAILKRVSLVEDVFIKMCFLIYSTSKNNPANISTNKMPKKKETSIP